jgi:hypothetical protein
MKNSPIKNRRHGLEAGEPDLRISMAFPAGMRSRASSTLVTRSHNPCRQVATGASDRRRLAPTGAGGGAHAVRRSVVLGVPCGPRLGSLYRPCGIAEPGVPPWPGRFAGSPGQGSACSSSAAVRPPAPHRGAVRRAARPGRASAALSRAAAGLGRARPRRVAWALSGPGLPGLPVECGAERLCAPGGRRPVGVLDDVDDMAGMLGGDGGWHAFADPVDQLHDVLEDM